MEATDFITQVENYRKQLQGILSRFSESQEGIHIGKNDEALLRQVVRELDDLFSDQLGSNNYSEEIQLEFNRGLNNYLRSPSYKSVENIIAIIKAAHTRFSRSPNLLSEMTLKNDQLSKCLSNVFIIHGHDEAKWRELQGILTTRFKLNPIVLSLQPDAGAVTIIEKFEHYAKTCSYAIALFTPDDQVGSGEEAYVQARPNVIYELGWFCGHLGRSKVMLLLKEGTSVFSDFGGIIQKRFSTNISEKIIEIEADLIAAGILTK